MSTMLGSPWDLEFAASGEVITDVESLARGVMGAERWPIFLEPCDNEELLAHLLESAFVLEARYRPQRGIEARPWLFQRLRWAARDWRDRHERHRTLPELPPLEPGIGIAEPARGKQRDSHRQSGIGAGVIGAPSEPPPGDRGDDGEDALRGLLEGGDRTLLRAIEALGLGPPPGTRGRTPAARRRLAALDRRRRERVARLEREAIAA